jgi:hypothetical protein
VKNIKWHISLGNAALEKLWVWEISIKNKSLISLGSFSVADFSIRIRVTSPDVTTYAAR